MMKDNNQPNGDRKQILLRTETLSKVKHSSKFIDMFARQPRSGSALGTVACIIAYVVILVKETNDSPAVYVTNTLWSAFQDPVPVTVRCDSATTCYASNRFTADPADDAGPFATESAQIAKIPSEEAECAAIAPGEERVFHMWYSKSQGPRDGLSILAKNDATLDVQPIASLLSDMECGVEVFPFWTQGYKGTSQVTVVRSHNTTVKDTPGEDRTEFFIQHLTSDGTILTGSTPCSEAAHPEAGESWADYAQFRPRMAPAMHQVNVEQPYFRVWSLTGDSGGGITIIFWLGFVSLMLAEMMWNRVSNHH